MAGKRAIKEVEENKESPEVQEQDNKRKKHHPTKADIDAEGDKAKAARLKAARTRGLKLEKRTEHLNRAKKKKKDAENNVEKWVTNGLDEKSKVPDEAMLDDPSIARVFRFELLSAFGADAPKLTERTFEQAKYLVLQETIRTLHKSQKLTDRGKRKMTSVQDVKEAMDILELNQRFAAAPNHRLVSAENE